MAKLTKAQIEEMEEQNKREVVAYMASQIGIVLTQKVKGRDQLPLVSSAFEMYDSLILGFNSVFKRATVNEETGEINWPPNPYRGLVEGQFDYYEAATSVVLDLEDGVTEEQLQSALSKSVQEHDTLAPRFFPKDPRTTEEPALGPFAAARCWWWLKGARQVLSGEDRAKFPPLHLCSAADVLNFFDVNVIPIDRDVETNDPKDLDNHEEAKHSGTRTLAEMRKQFGNKVRMGLVEYAKFEPLQRAAVQWHKWVEATGAQHDLVDEITRGIENMRQYVEERKKDGPQIETRTKTGRKKA